MTAPEGTTGIGGEGRRGFAALLVGVGTVLAATPVQAQERDAAAAEALFERARTLAEAGQLTDACPLFEESHRLDPGVGVLLYLAACHESAGRIATAWATFREARSAAEAQGQVDRVKVADARIAALEPRLPRMRIVVPEQAESQGWIVRRDDLVLGAPLWETDMPVDPGESRVEVLAPGFKPFSITVQVREGLVTRVELPPLVPDTTTYLLTPSVARPSSEMVTDWTSMHTAAVVVGGAGVIGVALGTGFGIAAASQWDEASDHCTRDTTPWRCDAIGVNAAEATDTHAAVSTGAFVVGGAALATGIVLWIVSPDLGQRSTEVGIASGPGDAGLALAGSF